MTTDQRIENLEKGLASARRLNRWLLAAVGLALGIWILAGTFGPTMAAAPGGGAAVKEVRAREFILEDEKGNERARLSMGNDGPALALYGVSGRAGAGLNANKDGSVLILCDENGKDRIMLNVGKDGPALALSDDIGKTRLMLDTSKNGPAIALCDANSKVRAALTTDKDGAALRLNDPKGVVRACLTGGPNETSLLHQALNTPRLALFDWNGQLRADLSPAFGLSLRDENGKVTWEAPQRAPVSVMPGTK